MVGNQEPQEVLLVSPSADVTATTSKKKTTTSKKKRSKSVGHKQHESERKKEKQEDQKDGDVTAPQRKKKVTRSRRSSTTDIVATTTNNNSQSSSRRHRSKSQRSSPTRRKSATRRKINNEMSQSERHTTSTRTSSSSSRHHDLGEAINEDTTQQHEIDMMSKSERPPTSRGGAAGKHSSKSKTNGHMSQSEHINSTRRTSRRRRGSITTTKTTKKSSSTTKRSKSASASKSSTTSRRQPTKGFSKSTTSATTSGERKRSSKSPMRSQSERLENNFTTSASSGERKRSKSPMRSQSERLLENNHFTIDRSWLGYGEDDTNQNMPSISETSTKPMKRTKPRAQSMNHMAKTSPQRPLPSQEMLKRGGSAREFFPSFDERNMNADWSSPLTLPLSTTDNKPKQQEDITPNEAIINNWLGYGGGDQEGGDTISMPPISETRSSSTSPPKDREQQHQKPSRSQSMNHITKTYTPPPMKRSGSARHFSPYSSLTDNNNTKNLSPMSSQSERIISNSATTLTSHLGGLSASDTDPLEDALTSASRSLSERSNGGGGTGRRDSSNNKTGGRRSVRKSMMFSSTSRRNAESPPPLMPDPDADAVVTADHPAPLFESKKNKAEARFSLVVANIEEPDSYDDDDEEEESPHDNRLHQAFLSNSLMNPNNSTKIIDETTTAQDLPSILMRSDPVMPKNKPSPKLQRRNTSPVPTTKRPSNNLLKMAVDLSLPFDTNPSTKLKRWNTNPPPSSSPNNQEGAGAVDGLDLAKPMLVRDSTANSATPLLSLSQSDSNLLGNNNISPDDIMLQQQQQQEDDSSSSLELSPSRTTSTTNQEKNTSPTTKSEKKEKRSPKSKFASGISKIANRSKGNKTNSLSKSCNDAKGSGPGGIRRTLTAPVKSSLRNSNQTTEQGSNNNNNNDMDLKALAHLGGPKKVWFNMEPIEHEGEDVTRIWYSKETLAELIAHEVQITQRGAHKSLHCCWRGLEHIQQKIDKGKKILDHVHYVQAQHRSLLQLQQQQQQNQQGVINGAGGNIDVAEELRKASSARSKDDRKQAWRLAKQDAKFVQIQRDNDLASDLEDLNRQMAKETARNNRSFATSVVKNISPLGPLATNAVSTTVMPLIIEGTSTATKTVSRAAIKGSKVVVGATTKTTKMAGKTALKGSKKVVGATAKTTMVAGKTVVGATTKTTKLAGKTVVGATKAVVKPIGKGVSLVSKGIGKSSSSNHGSPALESDVVEFSIRPT